MRKTPAWLVRLFLGVMVFFCLFLTAFVLLRANLTFQLADLSLSLETSRGRERKQQVEYDQVQAELPLTRAELEETQPLADAAVETVRQLRRTDSGGKPGWHEGRCGNLNKGMIGILSLVMAAALAVILILGTGILRDQGRARELARELSESRARWMDTAERKEALQKELKTVKESLKEARLTLEESTARAEELRVEIDALNREIRALTGTEEPAPERQE